MCSGFLGTFIWVTATGLDRDLPEPRAVTGADDEGLDAFFYIGNFVRGRCGGHAEEEYDGHVLRLRGASQC